MDDVKGTTSGNAGTGSSASKMADPVRSARTSNGADDQTIVGDTAGGSSGSQKPSSLVQKKENVPEPVPEVHPVRETTPTLSRDQKNSVASDTASKQEDLSNGARILEEHIIIPAPLMKPQRADQPAVTAVSMAVKQTPQPASPMVPATPKPTSFLTPAPVAPVSITPATQPQPQIIPQEPMRPAAPAKPELPKPVPPRAPAPLPASKVVPVTPPVSAPSSPPPVSSRIGSLSAALSARMPVQPEVGPGGESIPPTISPSPTPPSLPAPSPSPALSPLVSETKPPEEGARITPIVATPIPTPKKEVSEISRIVQGTKLPERVQPVAVAKEVAAAEGAPEARAIATTLADPTKPRAAPVPGPFTEPKMRVPAGDSLVSSIVAPFRTLKNDLQNIVRVKKISLVRAAAMEEDKRRHTSDIERGEHERVRSHRAFGIVFTVILLIALGSAALFGIYVIQNERTSAPQGSIGPSILFAESTLALPTDDRSALELKRLLAQGRAASSATLGSITRIVPTKTLTDPETGQSASTETTLEEFLIALGTRVPQELVRALAAQFFFGMHTVDENAPLFVIPVVSYEHAFAGMLAWEQTLNADLAPVFTKIPDQMIGSGGLPEKRRFEDIVMRNYDVRAQKDDAGQIELYYSFPTQRLLIIGESPYSFTEVLSRLRAERKL